MEVFLELLSCGCCVDIQHYEVYNILSNAARLYKRILHCCCDVMILCITEATMAIHLPVSTVNCKFCMVIVNTYGRIIGGLDWDELSQDRDRLLVLVHEPSGSIKCRELLD